MDRRTFLRGAATVGLASQASLGAAAIVPGPIVGRTGSGRPQHPGADALTVARDWRGNSGIRTGFADLDWLTGGLRPGSLVAIASRPSLGKTTLALNIARYLAFYARRPVVFFTPGESALCARWRLLSALASIGISKITHGQRLDAVEGRRLNAAASALDRAPLLIDDRALPTVLDIKACALMHALRCRAPLSAIVIDNPELLEERDPTSSPIEQMAAVMTDLRDAAREFHAPVLVTTGVGRRLENRRDKRPRITDLRGSASAIAKVVDMLLLIYRDEVYNEDSTEKDYAEIIVARNAFGETGTIRLAFRGERALFYDVPVLGGA